MSDTIYTALTFASVQGFIEKSRKLRDLYGSSYLLSHLALALCKAAGEERVISPALINLAQGTPNQILIAGDFPQQAAKAALDQTWKGIVRGCREWIEGKISVDYRWRSDWEQWANHTWEFFWAQGATISAARRKLNQVKRSRNWTGINWTGESSTLSGADAVAWPGSGRGSDPRKRNLTLEDREIKQFYAKLVQIPALGEPFVGETEQLSMPELVKRLVTYPVVAREIGIPEVELPDSFRDVGRSTNGWKGWFKGDGDRLGAFLKELSEISQDEATALHQFSQAMRRWGEEFLKPSLSKGRVIYAGGDDFLGVFVSESGSQISAQHYLDWFQQFPQIWQTHGYHKLTVSVGFVWAGPQVPQRDVLHHCREAEQSAKNQGRDRLALRVLFNGGTHLEWVCPWWFLFILSEYRDRRGSHNWTHFYNDVATLTSRHAFGNNQADVALALFEIYFGEQNRTLLEANLWGQSGNTAILTDPKPDDDQIATLINDWITQLAQVGFHLCSQASTI